MGIRDIEDLSALAKAVGLVLWEDYAMPANNEMLVFVPVHATGIQPTD